MDRFEYRNEYWSAAEHWSLKNRDIVLKLESPVREDEINNPSDFKKSPKINKITKERFLLPLLNLELMFYSTITILVAVLMLIIIQPISFAISLLLIFISSLAMIKISKDRHSEHEVNLGNNNAQQANPVEVVFEHSGLNANECQDTVNLLNKLKASNNKNEYEKIVKNLLHEEKEYYEGKAEHDKILNGLNNKTVMNRVVTDEVHQSNELSGQTYIFNGAIMDVTDLKKKFITVTTTIEKLQAGRNEIKVLEDCYNEIFSNTLKFEEIVDAGGIISNKEWESFSILLNTCESIIKAYESKELDGSLSDSTLISSIYLNSKYNMKEELYKGHSI